MDDFEDVPAPALGTRADEIAHVVQLLTEVELQAAAHLAREVLDPAPVLDVLVYAAQTRVALLPHTKETTDGR